MFVVDTTNHSLTPVHGRLFWPFPDPLYILFGVKLGRNWENQRIALILEEIGILYGADGGVTETRSDHNRVQGSVDNFKYSGNIFFGAGWSFHKVLGYLDYTPKKNVKNKEKKGEGDSNHGPHLIPRTPSITIARRSTHMSPAGNLSFFWISLGTRVGHADASADAHRMRINAHRCASSAYCAKNVIPFFAYKLPF